MVFGQVNVGMKLGTNLIRSKTTPQQSTQNLPYKYLWSKLSESDKLTHLLKKRWQEVLLYSSRFYRLGGVYDSFSIGRFLRKFALHEKTPNTEFYLVRIFLHSDQKKLLIWTLFTLCCFIIIRRNSTVSNILEQRI